MKFLKSLLMGTGGVVLAGLVLALLAPKAVHAIVATAVQVVNTSANPAITEDTSRQASQIVTIRCGLFGSDGGNICQQVLPGGGSGPFGPRGGYVVPANQYFVLKSIDSQSPACATLVTIQGYTPFDVDGAQFELISIQPNGQYSFSSGIVVAPGVELLPLQPSSCGFFLTLHGYLTSN
jgi:hypothetical protein